MILLMVHKSGQSVELGSLSHNLRQAWYISGGDRRISEPSTVSTVKIWKASLSPCPCHVVPSSEASRFSSPDFGSNSTGPLRHIYIYIPGTCLSSILVLQPSNRRPFPIKTGVIWAPGIQIYVYINVNINTSIYLKLHHHDSFWAARKTLGFKSSINTGKPRYKMV